MFKVKVLFLILFFSFCNIGFTKGYDTKESFIKGLNLKGDHVITLTVDNIKYLKSKNISWYDVISNAPEARFKVSDELKEIFLKNEKNNTVALSCQMNNKYEGQFRPLLDNIKNSILETSKKTSGLDSITDDNDLMSSLYLFSNNNGKDFSSVDELKSIVQVGETVIKSILDGNDVIANSEQEAEDVFISILWYIQAKSGRSIVLNPTNWNLERGFVKGGTYRFFDGRKSSKIYNALKRLSPNVYERISSHFPEESIDKHRGLDIKESKIPLPGKEGTKTILFGHLFDNSTFIKAETAGVGGIKDTVSHGMNYIHHMQMERSGARKESYAHRETPHKVIKKMFKDYIKEKSISDDINQNILKSSKLGVSSMIKELSTNELFSDSKGQNLKKVISNYKEIFCSDLNSDKESSRDDITTLLIQNHSKGCEAIIDIAPDTSH